VDRRSACCERACRASAPVARTRRLAIPCSACACGLASGPRDACGRRHVELAIISLQRAADRAQQAQVTLAEIQRNVQAAENLLHDIGEVAIPFSILEKPGPLNDYEWEPMRCYPVIGTNILGSAPAVAPVAAIVRACHERIDGTGYPDGLAGPAIPLASRILFLCDAFRAMTSDRAYRKATSQEQAMAELQRSVGTQFDPAVIDALAEHLREELRDRAPREAITAKSKLTPATNASAARGGLPVVRDIEGKPVVSARILAALVRESPVYDYEIVEWTNDGCAIDVHRNGKKLEPTVAFTENDAGLAELNKPTRAGKPSTHAG
jgi:hypothetical protein